MSALVKIIMGSDSDLPVMQGAADILDDLGVSYEMTIVSAHRTPHRLVEFAENAHKYSPARFKDHTCFCVFGLSKWTDLNVLVNKLFLGCEIIVTLVIVFRLTSR